MEEQRRVKVVVVGDREADKTEMLITYARGQYPEYVPTLLDDYDRVHVVPDSSGKEVVVSLWEPQARRLTQGFDR